MAAARSVAFATEPVPLDGRLGPMRQESARRILLMLKKSLYLASKPAQRGVLRSSHVSVPAVPALVGCTANRRCQPQRGSRWSLRWSRAWLARCAVCSEAFGPVLSATVLGGFSEISLAAAIRSRPTTSAVYRALLQHRSAEILPICQRVLDAAILRQSRCEPPA